MHKVCPGFATCEGEEEQQFCVSRVVKQRFHASQNFEVVQSASILYNLTRI